MDHRSRHSVAVPSGGVREQVKATVKNVLRRKRDEDGTPRTSRRQSSVDDLGEESSGKWNQLFRRHHNKDLSGSVMSSPPESSGTQLPARSSMWKKAIHKIHNKSADSDQSTKATDSRMQSTSPIVQGHSIKPSAGLHSNGCSGTRETARATVARVAAVSADGSNYYSRTTEQPRSVIGGRPQRISGVGGGGGGVRSTIEPESNRSTYHQSGRRTIESRVCQSRVRAASRPRTPPQSSTTPLSQQKAHYAVTPPTGTSTHAGQQVIPSHHGMSVHSAYSHPVVTQQTRELQGHTLNTTNVHNVGGGAMYHTTSVSSKVTGRGHGMLTERGTPVDLTCFFESRPWTPERFTRLQRLAPAIHGEVSLYHDNLENKDVVVKQLANASVRPRGPQELENPLVEIGAMTYLFSEKALHPVDMVARLEGVYQDELHTYMVSEYCTDGELFKEVVRRKNLSERHVKAIALQLALALSSLHRNGICHRDVSLENTLIQSDHTVRLIDFGQAECCYEPDGSPKLMQGSAGKAYYRAPEMLRGPYTGPPVDVFALGVEIFIMAIGSPPWAKASLQDQRYRSLTKYRTSLDISLRKWGKREQLSDAFVDILSNIFTSSPKQRPTIDELLCHPWFSYDASVWTWVDQRSVSRTIREHAVRVEMYLKSHPQGTIGNEDQENVRA